MNIQLFLTQKSFDDSPSSIMSSFPISNSKKLPNHYSTTCQIKITYHKIWRLMWFELACATIWPNKVSRRGISFFNDVSPMLSQAKLHKIWIMFVVIIYVKVVFSYKKGICIIQAKIGVRMIGNVDQNWNLVRMPVHGLYFILNCKRIVLCKVNHWHNRSKLDKLQT